MAIVLIIFAAFIFMWIVALVGLVAIIVNMFLKDHFYTEDSPSHTIRTT
jgi:hypothetical protein